MMTADAAHELVNQFARADFGGKYSSRMYECEHEARVGMNRRTIISPDVAQRLFYCLQAEAQLWLRRYREPVRRKTAEEKRK